VIRRSLLRLGLALVLAVPLALVHATPAQAADGDLDTSFSSDGKAIYGRTQGNDGLYHVFTQANGDLVLSGWDDNNVSKPTAVRWSGIEVNSSGSNTGLFSNPDDRLFWSPRTDTIYETLLMSDGRYAQVGVAGTHTTNANKDYDCAVVVREADGGLDTSFSGNGKVFVTFSGSKDDKCWAGAVQSDDKIIAAGYVSTNSADIALARLNTDGTLDTSFSSDGKIIANLGGSDSIRAVEIDANGKIVVAGKAANDFFVSRYTTAGALDTSFSSDGIHTFDLGAGNTDQLWGMKIQDDGKIVVAGFNGSGNIGVARLNADGTMDSGFGSGGITITDFGGSDDRAYDLAVASDGKILVGGYTNTAGNYDFAVARYTSAGVLDSGFSSDGKATVDVRGSNRDDYAYSLAIAGNGSVVLAGKSRTNTSGTRHEWAVAQVLSSTGPPGSIAMAAFGKFRGDDQDTVIATHEDPAVTTVPGGYLLGSTMNSIHEDAQDFVVNGTDRIFTLVLGAQPTSNVVLD
jgi:uncharacterized delta-60 repeat protein